MRDFFRGWRRKMGVITLVATLPLMMLWVRSYIVRDAIIVQDAGFVLASLLGRIEWNWKYVYEVPGPAIEWTTIDFRKIHPEYLGPEYRTPDEIPHWSIVLPLTLLSAFLLLSKPRIAKPAAPQAKSLS